VDFFHHCILECYQGEKMKFRLFTIFFIGLLISACSAKVAVSPQPASTQENSTLIVGNENAAASGIVVAAEDAQMAFSTNGILKKINYREGEMVQTGQVLAELENDLIQNDYAQAQRTLKELTSPASIAAAAEALAVARQGLKDQQDDVDAQFYRRASDTLIENTQGQIDLAKRTLALASDTYKTVARKPDGDNRKATALVAMTNAQLRLNDLIAKYNWLVGRPSEIDVALSQAKLDAAKAAVQEAEWYLAELKGEPIPATATGKNLAGLASAKNSVASLKDKLEHTRLISPISGAVIKVNAVQGESISAGQILFSISNISDLHIETSDLSERDVPKIHIGQTAMVSVKALNVTVTGKVIRISPVADILGGDVVYKTVIELDEIPEGLLTGMSVDVIYETIK